MLKLVVITAGLSNPSSTRKLADSMAASVTARITARGEAVTTTVIELRELALDLAGTMVNWNHSSAALDEAKRVISQADGLIAVTPAFQGSYSGLFKMFFDTLSPSALDGMPTLVGATGGSARHALLLDFAVRPLMSYLHAVVVPTSIFLATDDYGSSAGAEHTARLGKAADQLAQLMLSVDNQVAGLSPSQQGSAGNPKRRSGLDLEEEFIPFDQLLLGHTGESSAD